jgi:hypothetical protein
MKEDVETFWDAQGILLLEFLDNSEFSGYYCATLGHLEETLCLSERENGLSIQQCLSLCRLCHSATSGPVSLRTSC